MPFINAKVTPRMTPEQKEKLSRALGQAVCEVLKKPAKNTMVGIEEGYDLWMGGTKLEKGAFVSVEHRGAGSIVKYNSLTEKICAALDAELGIPGPDIYVNFKMINEWGRDGRILG